MASTEETPATESTGGAPKTAAPAKESSFRRELRAWTRDLLLAIGLALVIIVFLYRPVKVEGTSMAPLLEDQERIFINQFVYRFESIQRGDVVVFWFPEDPSMSFIKRVIGLPGDRVEIREGMVYVNDGPIAEPYVPGAFRVYENRPAVVVKRGYYYVLGDHRSKSFDSRFWGLVPQRYIYGKVVFAYWPPEHAGRVE